MLLLRECRLATSIFVNKSYKKPGRNESNPIYMLNSPLNC